MTTRTRTLLFLTAASALLTIAATPPCACALADVPDAPELDTVALGFEAPDYVPGFGRPPVFGMIGGTPEQRAAISDIQSGANYQVAAWECE